MLFYRRRGGGGDRGVAFPQLLSPGQRVQNRGGREGTIAFSAGTPMVVMSVVRVVMRIMVMRGESMVARDVEEVDGGGRCERGTRSPRESLILLRLHKPEVREKAAERSVRG